jgi:dTDP-4-dehydrorhamnose reductase
VQFSSDYIFRGDLARPLTETDAPAPLSVYGHQKAALERDIPALCPRSLVIRLSWLYGPGGRTFMSLLPGLLATQGSLRVAAGKTGTCLYAPDAAQSVRQLLEHKQVGRFNLVNTGDTSWEEFARACLEEMDSLGLAPACRQIIEVPYGQLGANWNKRPRSSGLDTTKIAHALPPGLRHWREALKAFLHTQVALGDLTRAEL